ncbi:MAG: riboflavin synthase [Nitrospinota bacterium]|jgi:riboflavin synthase|nr:riboflavin synthase [Nitrospinota bacterium]MDP6484106.1 riboflavin synthase [Nitrospinota bacterium]MDP7384879.1 riboflavin synthase [Nitrospinota bacterium]
MFTGIIEHVGTVESIRAAPDGARLSIRSPEAAGELGEGDSVAVNGACLTKVGGNKETFAVDVSPESLKKTNLGALRKGDPLNLELAMRLGDRLGGHMVSGHVDAVGRIEDRRAEGDSEIVAIQAPPEVMRYVVSKGSVAVDGISLTIAERETVRFRVAIIPHTALKTTLLSKKPGDPVNLEADLIGKYVERLLSPDSEGGTGGMTKEFLVEHGYA